MGGMEQMPVRLSVEGTDAAARADHGLKVAAAHPPGAK